MHVKQVESPHIRLLDKHYTKEEFDRCVDVLSAAFSHHPMMLAMHDNNQELIRLRYARDLFDSIPKSTVYVTGETSGVISSVLMIGKALERTSSSASGLPDTPVQPPGTGTVGTENSYRREYDSKLPEYIKEYSRTVYRDQFVKFTREFGDDWQTSAFVDNIGTWPASQGQGLGSALMQFLIDSAAKNNNGFVLASWLRDTTLFYECLGFELRVKDHFASPQGGRFDLWGLFCKGEQRKP